MLAGTRKIPVHLALMLGLLLAPASLFATNFELSRIAAEISQASYRLADGLRYANGYSSVRSSASRLSSEAEQLVRAISYNRSGSYIRSEFRDIARRYQELERDYLRASRQRLNNFAYTEMDRISYLFTSLSNVVYYGQRAAPAYGGYSYVPPVGYRSHVPAVPRSHAGTGRNGSRQANQRPNRFDYGTRTVPLRNN